MSRYDDIGKELESLHKCLYVDDIGENNITLLYYGNNIEDDLLYTIETDYLCSYDNKHYLQSIEVDTNSTETKIYLYYKCDIGKDEKTEEELYEESLDDAEERKNDAFPMSRGGLNDSSL